MTIIITYKSINNNQCKAISWLIFMWPNNKCHVIFGRRTFISAILNHIGADAMITNVLVRKKNPEFQKDLKLKVKPNKWMNELRYHQDGLRALSLVCLQIHLHQPTDKSRTWLNGCWNFISFMIWFNYLIN